MFGYITINKAEMKFKEFDIYHAFYCGLCQSLLKRYGALGQITLSYDMTFAGLLLSSLYEPETVSKKCACIAHPLERHPYVRNEIIDYVADMNVLLTLYKCEDDWIDDKKLYKACFGSMLRKKSHKKRAIYRSKENVIKDTLGKIHDLEKEGCTDIDLMSGLFGDIMGIVMTLKDDEWKETLTGLGYYLGKYIYILDAYDDVEKDVKKGKYNPFVNRFKEPDFDEQIRVILTMMMSECCKYFEQLPIIENVEILRNILYSGVWERYETVRQQREKEKV